MNFRGFSRCCGREVVIPRSGVQQKEPMGRLIDALEKRRFEAMRLFERGLKQSVIARQVRVVPQTVARWVQTIAPAASPR